MTIPLDTKMVSVIAKAVHHAISVVGLDGLRATSLFPSSAKLRKLK